MFDVRNVTTWLKKNVTKYDILILGGIVLLYLLTRLINLERLPIFSDEGIYVQWARTAWKDASMRFVSLTDGRQPLQTWGTIPFLKMFPENPLFAGRMFSVATGFFALTGMVSMMWYLFNKRAAYIAALLYIFTPYFIFYDRIALVDSAINAFTIWMFFFSILLARTRRLDVALLLGFFTGFALLGKSSVRLYAGLMLFAGIFVLYETDEGGLWNMIKSLKSKVIGKASRVPHLISFVLLYGVTVGFAALIYNIQRLSPYLHFVELKNTTFVLTLPELIQDPFAYFPHNIVNLPYYIVSEMGFVVAFLGIVGMFILWKKDRTLTIYLLVWFIAAIMAISLVAKVLFPRYVLSLGGLLLIPAAYMISQIKEKRNIWGVVGLIFVSIAFFNYAIWFNPINIPFPQIDRGQYLEGWPAGFGAQQIVEYAREQSATKRVYLVAQGDFGMSGDVLRTFIREGEPIHVRAYWPLDNEHLVENQPELADSHVFVVYSHCKEPNYEGDVLESDKCYTFEDTKPLRLIQRFEKPGNKNAIYLFELLPAQQ